MFLQDFQSRTITSVYVHPSDANQVFLTFSGFGTSKIYKSTNSGSSWTSIQGNLPDTPVNDLLIFTDNTGYPNTYFAATDVGVFVTENNGTSWFEITAGLPNTVIMHLDYSPLNKMLRAGTHGRGVYEAFVDFNIPVEITSFTALIEGLYNGTEMIPDTVTVELRNTSFPYLLVDQTKIVLNNNGQGTGKFYSADNGTPYYIVLKHRNALETWSKTGQSFTNNALAYDFTTASDKAYGNNLVLKNNKWCIYSGDVNQDGFISSEDLNIIFIDNVNGAIGYNATDLNGDVFTEIDDVNIVFVNSVFSIDSKRPPGI